MATITTFAYDAVGGVPSYTSGNIIDWLYQLTFRANGVLPGSDGGLAVSTDGTGNALVQNGVCALGGRTAVLTAGPQSVAMSPLPANGFRTSYAIVMRYNTSTRTTAVVAIAGSTIANPGPAVNPSVNTLIEVPLAYVLAVNTGSIAYTVTDARTFTDTGTLAPTGSITYTASDLNINSSIIAPIAANSMIDITAGSIYKGTKLFIKNATSGSYTLTIHYSGSLGDIALAPGAWVALAWDGSGWVNTTVNSDWDLVIDSNAKLDLLCQHTGGLYKRVLIRTGTWTASALSPTAGVLVNLDNTGTKYVFAEKGASIVYSGSYAGTMYGLYRAAATTDYTSEKFEGINITLTNSNASGAAVAFSRITNAVSCGATISSPNNSLSSSFFSNCLYVDNCKGLYNDPGYCLGFYNCQYVTNCNANVTYTNASALSIPTGYSTCNYVVNCASTVGGTTGSVYGFASCNRINNCIGTSSATTGKAVGFYSCIQVDGCYAVSSANGAACLSYGFDACTNMAACNASCTANAASGGVSGFNACNYISGCDSTIIASNGTVGYGYNSCRYISASRASATGSSTQNIIGFITCLQIVACSSVGGNSGAGTAYGYYNCTRMQQNNCPSAKTSAFLTSYADAASAAPCADTAAGGYNS